MEYTFEDLKVGTKLRCTQATPAHWTAGKLYEISDEDGELAIKDDHGDDAYRNYMLDCLNGKHKPVKFEIIKEEKQVKYTENDLKDGTKMTCIDNNDTPWWTIGKIYEVQKSKLSGSGLCIIDDQGSERYLDGILARLNNRSTGVQFEIIEEEKETQYELVEKELPTLKANVNVDTLEVIEAKIEQLANEQANLYNKRMRIKHQEEALCEKRMKLKEAKKSLEFLKQQNYL